MSESNTNTTSVPVVEARVVPAGYQLVKQNMTFRTIKASDTERYNKLLAGAKLASVVLEQELQAEIKDEAGKVLQVAGVLSVKRPSYELEIVAALIDTVMKHPRGVEYFNACIKQDTFNVAKGHVDLFLEVKDSMVALDDVLAKKLDSCRKEALNIPPAVKAAVVLDFQTWAESNGLPTDGVGIIVKNLKAFFNTDGFRSMDLAVRTMIQSVLEKWFSSCTTDNQTLYTDMMTAVFDNIDKAKEAKDISASLFAISEVKEESK